MATLNHANLTTFNVPALSALFRDVFDFTVLDTRGDKLAVLRNDEDFLLTLMFDKNMTPEAGYPGFFHVGFRQTATKDVDLVHTRFVDNLYAAPAPGIINRGGPPTYGFYFEAPGGVTVEVSTMNL